jgi:hypothetical protein
MSEHGSVSVSALIEQLRLEGIFVSEDSLQRLRDHELIEKPRRLGRGRGSAYTNAQVEHVRAVLLLQGELGKKWSFSELAFWMAAYKLHNVPVELTAEYIDANVQLFVKTLNRLTERHGRGRAQPGDTLARKMARYFVRRSIVTTDEVSRQASALAQDALEICLSLWYFNETPSKTSRVLRRIIYSLYDPADADKQFLDWQQFLAEHATLFSENFRVNRLVSGVQKALGKQPKLITLAARDALLCFTLLQNVLDSVPGVKPRLAKSNVYLHARMAQGLVPILAALSVDIQLDNSRNSILRRLRDGDDFGTKSFLDSLTTTPTRESE